MPAWVKFRGERLIMLALVVLFVFLSVIYLVVQKAGEFSPKYFTNTVLLTVLGFANAILILALLYVLLRNLILLVAERRAGTLGSQFKTKLVVIFLGLTLIPSILLFVASGKLIEHSIKKWFATPVDEVVRASQEVLDATYERYRQEALHFASEVAQEMKAQNLLEKSGRRRLRPVLEERLRRYRLDLIMVSAGGEAPMTVVNPQLPLVAIDALPWDIVQRAQAGESADRLDDLASGRMVRAAVAIPGTGGTATHPEPAVVSVGYFIPPELAGLTRRMARSAENYLQTKALESPIQRSYYLVLILVAVVVVFSTVWVGLSLARRITVPIQKLAEGTRKVAAGDLDFQLKVNADDEFGILMDSFNKMTQDLRSAKTSEERSRQELEARRLYMETLLENITPGVISLNREGRVTTINRSAARILDVERPEDVPGLTAGDLLARPEHAGLAALLAGSPGTREQTLSFTAGTRSQIVTATVTPLTDAQEQNSGLIMVLEDVTQLIRAEKVAAWQDVARRLAHEIKNPLTPIQLSAQRIAKKFRESSPDFPQVVEEGTRSIVDEVAALKGLLDEFAQFARLPAVRPRPADIRQVLDQAIALFDGVHPDIRFQRLYHAGSEQAEIDTDQMKRVCVNLFDNAVESMDESGTIRVVTRPAAGGRALRIEVSDEGRGIPEPDRARLFLPYFSTKARGTGLGLAIVSRIISDHDGSVRFEENSPRGSRFIIELPVSGAGAPRKDAAVRSA